MSGQNDEYTKILIRDLQISASIGVYHHEKLAFQPILVNIELTLGPDLRAEPAIFVPAKNRRQDPDYADVVCYASVCEQVERLARDKHTELVETLVEAIAELCLSDGRVQAVRARVEKTAAVPRARAVGAEIFRRRKLMSQPL